eukprot:9485927-Pyramimonas_sp.AAC.1
MMLQARALRVTIVLAGPPIYFWRQGPMRYVIENLNSQGMRMRFCHFCLKCDRANMLPRGSYLQVATTCTRIPTNLWRFACNIAGEPAEPTEHFLDCHGQGAQKTEWQNKTQTILTARLTDQMGSHKHKGSTQVLYI